MALVCGGRNMQHQGKYNSKGKLIVIAGTDGSGKATQTNLLFKKLVEQNISISRGNFPKYNTPTGKIIGGPLQGKPEICESYFKDPANIDPKVASLYYAGDRRYALPIMREILNSGKHLLLDRYVESNMGHQGGKIRNPEERKKFYRWLEKLEYEMLALPRPDLTILLQMPFEKGIKLKSKMTVSKDKVEESFDYLKNSEEAYLQLAELYGWKRINCTNNNKIKSKQEIHKEVYEIVREIL